jgi:BirA family biotin operon repressor/biotin-[acetyl-CoA-carboxylase] ligase
MVNAEKAQSTRGKILLLLRENTEYLSGERIAFALGVSRVSVWKGIKALTASGYSIASSPEGYRLKKDVPDSLFPWEFGVNEKRFRHWEETDSTMNRAREAALEGTDDGLVVTAAHQSDGHGTENHTWESVPGGLFFTLVTRPSVNPQYVHRQVLAAQLAMVRAVKRVSGIDIFPGWPNDLFVAGAGGSLKAGGILAETLSSGNTVIYQNLGIGMNTGEAPVLQGTAGIRANRKDLLQAFLAEFPDKRASPPELVAQWNALCPLAGKEVRYTAPSGPTPEKGIFRGVDPAGCAIIETVTDSPLSAVQRFAPGEIHIVQEKRK